MAAKIAGLCVAAALMCTLLRRQHPELAGALALGTGIATAYMLLGDMQQIAESFLSLSTEGGMDTSTGKMLLQTVGIALIAEFAAQLCRDSGESAMAGRIALAARVSMLAASLPMLTKLLRLVMGAFA